MTSLISHLLIIMFKRSREIVNIKCMFRFYKTSVGNDVKFSYVYFPNYVELYMLHVDKSHVNMIMCMLIYT